MTQLGNTVSWIGMAQFPVKIKDFLVFTSIDLLSRMFLTELLSSKLCLFYVLHLSYVLTLVNACVS